LDFGRARIVVGPPKVADKFLFSLFGYSHLLPQLFAFGRRRVLSLSPLPENHRCSVFGDPVLGFLATAY
jgi:hypothetical protein